MSMSMGAGSAETDCIANVTTFDGGECTYMCWYNGSSADWATTARFMVMGEEAATAANRLSHGNAGAARAYANDVSSAGSGDATPATAAVYDLWVPIFGSWTAGTNVVNRCVVRNTSTADASADITGAADSTISIIRVGSTPSGFTTCPGLIAEIAMWDAALTTAEMDSVWTGADSGIDARSVDTSASGANLLHYWKIDSDTTAHENLGSESATLAMVGTATYSADNPIIAAFGTNETVYPFTGPWR